MGLWWWWWWWFCSWAWLFSEKKIRMHTDWKCEDLTLVIIDSMNHDFKINFMHLNAHSRSYNWPNRDICWALSSRNLLSWRQYHISKEDDLFIENILPPWIFLFFILPEFFSKSPQTKYNISHDWEKFNNQSFLEDFEKINWNQVLQLRYYATLNFWKTQNLFELYEITSNS